MQLAAIAVFVALVALQALAFRFVSDSWVEAMSAARGLWFIHFLVAFAGVERFAREDEA